MPPALLSDVEGRIAHVFFALPAFRPDIVPKLLTCIRAVMDTLEPSVRCTVLCHPEHAPGVEAAAGGHPLDLVPWTRGGVVRIPAGQTTIVGKTLRIGRLPSWGDFTAWAQDSFLVCRDDGDSTILASPHVYREFGSIDEEVPPAVAQHLGWRHEVLPGRFEAGNVLVDRRGVTVGAAIPAEADETASRALLSRLKALSTSTTGVRVVPAKGRAPVRHQDIYLTLAGEREDDRPLALVGSLRLAASLWNAPLESMQVEEKFDQVAADLEADGYIVQRLPLAYFQAAEGMEPGWISYNNALVERWTDSEGERRRVTLASYGTDGGDDLAMLDRAAGSIWSSLGFEVRFATGPFTWLSQFKGSVRCLTKVLARR